MKSPLVVATAAASAVSAALAFVRRRRSQVEAKIWRDATSDTSR